MPRYKKTFRRSTITTRSSVAKIKVKQVKQPNAPLFKGGFMFTK